MMRSSGSRPSSKWQTKADIVSGGVASQRWIDLLNNLVGNMAEVLSPEAGAMARRFRTDMYAQLFDIRRAEAVYRAVPLVEEAKDTA